MKFNDLFRNRRNMYFVSLILIAMLLAGGIWQYNNYLGYKMSELDFENQLNELDKLLDNQGDAAKIIEDRPAEGSTDDGIKEVANTNNNPDPKRPTKPSDVKGPTANAPTTAQTAAAVKTEPVNIETMILPVFGNISMDYSDTTLVYSKTIDSWITHSGLDFKAEEGSTVRAALDGTVAQTVDDPQWGLTVVLDHGDGVMTRYSNLSTLDLVSEGQKVKKGDVISGVGKSALCEISEEPHLHFELMMDNKQIDPKNYLPKKL